MNSHIPLAERIRPQSLSQYISQKHLVGESGVLQKQIERGIVPSLILWGSPGTGKTTLAYLIAKESKRPFYTLSAINAGIKEVREVIDKAKASRTLFYQGQPLLFIDEIHRFNKTQQDSLLEAVEKGWITLIGATTENPSFEVIPALLSRMQVYVLNQFTKEDLTELLERALNEDVVLSKKNITLTQTDALLHLSGGDARKLLNTFELVVNAHDSPNIEITNDKVLQVAQKQTVRYDKIGEQHYDIISAFIKSIRGSDPNAAVYWLSRMLEGGEDVKFIARRMLISASEDIGNANPTALIMAQSTFYSVSIVGMPEARIILGQCAIYLASSPKSNATYNAINSAIACVKQTGDLSVPLHLRNAPTPLMKQLNYGDDYKYPHNYPQHFITQEYMPDGLTQTIFYHPQDNAKENAIRNYLKTLWGNKYEY